MSKHGLKVVYSKLLNGWFVVRGKHHFPLAGPFASKHDAKSWRRHGERNGSVNDLDAYSELNNRVYGNL